MAQGDHFECSFVPAPVAGGVVVALVAVFLFLRLTYVRRGQVEDLGRELGPPLQSFLLALALLRLVSLACLAELIVVHYLGKSILPRIFRL